MAGRDITLHWIAQTLATPDRVTGDPTDSALTRSFQVISEFGGRVLRVVRRRQEDQLFIVTAHWLK